MKKLKSEELQPLLDLAADLDEKSTALQKARDKSDQIKDDELTNSIQILLNTSAMFSKDGQAINFSKVVTELKSINKVVITSENDSKDTKQFRMDIKAYLSDLNEFKTPNSDLRFNILVYLSSNIQNNDISLTKCSHERNLFFSTIIAGQGQIENKYTPFETLIEVIKIHSTRNDDNYFKQNAMDAVIRGYSLYQTQEQALEAEKDLNDKDEAFNASANKCLSSCLIL